MTFALRGALVEYSFELFPLIPNVVVFQFNPDSISRTILIPPRPTTPTKGETTQAGDPPVEKFKIKLELDASDNLNAEFDVSLARAVGIGPALAALEKMAWPASQGLLSLGLDKAVDVIGSALRFGKVDPTQPIPRDKYPRTLFLWGPARILPVIIEGMTINELQYDFLLNPTRAEVSLDLVVIQPEKCSDDKIAKGVLSYMETLKETMALANLANAGAIVASDIRVALQ